MTRVLRARWVLPMDRPPVDSGWIEIAEGRVVALGRGRPPAAPEDLGTVAILPGLVNAHTHLELSWMAGRVPPAGAMSDWIRTLLRVRRAGVPDGRAGEIRAAHEALAAMRATGTVLVGDVSNTLVTPSLIRDAGLGGVVFHELLGFTAAEPARVVREAWARVHALEASLPADADGVPLALSVVAHAPYSVSPELFRQIAHAKEDAPLAVHLGESPEEIEFLRTGRGPMRDALESIGVSTEGWPVPACDPVRYMADLGYLQPGMLAVHGVHLTDDALERLRQADAVLVTCPRSNVWVGAGPPRLSHFYASGVPVAVGTDSLASVSTLSMFDELAEMRRLAPDVAAAGLLESATRIGARALGLEADYGTIGHGQRARFVVVDIPADEADVEEYLVSGVSADTVRVI
ncbi:MAG TPA: amidohydrolase family protein [Vicinamibacterales bacterium]|nr:amidohydrolase family protein [Vicinamibacterales bacterium]